MPCKKCGGSAREDGSGGVVVGLEYDEDGTARYFCLECTIDELESGLDEYTS